MSYGPTNIREVWDDIKTGLEFVKGETHEHERLEDIYAACVNGQATLWTADDISPEDGFLITQVKREPFSGQRYLLLWVAWCPDEEGAKRFQQYVEEVAKEADCSYIEFWTSKKEIRDHGIKFGYEQITYKCKKEI